MDIEGNSIFHLLPSAPNAEQLYSILRSLHKCQNKALNTYLLHPTPVSLSALDFIFQSELLSPYSTDFFQYLSRLSQMFVFYVLGHFILSLKENYPKYFQVYENEDKDQTIERLVRLILQIMDECEFTQTLSKLRQFFDRAVRCYLCLGVIPVILPSSPSISSFPDTGKGMSAYALFFSNWVKETMKIYKIIDVHSLHQDVLLTVCNGHYGCSDYKKNPLLLWTFNPECIIFKPQIPFRPPVLDMMQYEYQFTFANEKSRKMCIQKMSRTSLVVSSTFTEEVEDIIKASNNGYFNQSEAIDGLKKSKQLVNDLESKLGAIRSINPPSQDEGSKVRDLKHFEAGILNAARDINHVLEYNLYRKLIHPNNISDDIQEILSDTHLEPLHSGSIHNSRAGDQVSSYAREREQKIVEQHSLVDKLKALEKSASLLEKENQNMRDELVRLIDSQATLNQKLKEEKVSKEILKEEIGQLAKKNNQLEVKVKKYDELNDNTQQILAGIVKESNASIEDRRRMMNIMSEMALASHSGELDSQYQRRLDGDFLLRLFERFFSTNKSLRKEDLHDKNRTAQAYKEVLLKCSLKVLPFFSYITSKSALETNNFGLPYQWMHDIFLQEEVKTKVDLTGRQAITNTPELFMVDINPKSENEIARIKRRVELCNSSTLLDSVLKRQFLSIQYPTHASVEDCINQTLKLRWEDQCSKIFALTSNRFTITGNRIPPQLSLRSMEMYIYPFATQYLPGRNGGQHQLMVTIVNLENVLMSEVTQTDTYIYIVTHLLKGIL